MSDFMIDLRAMTPAEREKLESLRRLVNAEDLKVQPAPNRQLERVAGADGLRCITHLAPACPRCNPPEGAA